MPKIITKTIIKKEKPKTKIAKVKDRVVLKEKKEIKKEEIIEKEIVKKEIEEPIKEIKVRKYYEGVGRRKTATARVRLFTVKPFEEDEGKIIVNDKFYKEYFCEPRLQQTAESSLRKIKLLNRFEVTIKVKGGGIAAQAEAIRHAIARALIIFNEDFRKKLKRAGYLKRDPRMKERRKFGLKKARKAPQWSKR